MDEKHKKQRLGPTSKFEYRVYRDETNNIASKDNGGKLGDKICRTSLKYAEEARGAFGVCIRKLGDDSYEGIKCEPLSVFLNIKNLLKLKDY